MRPKNIVPAVSFYQFLKIKDRVTRWRGKDIESRDYSQVKKMVMWARERKKLHFDKDFHETLQKIERNVGMVYWVYSHKISDVF